MLHFYILGRMNTKWIPLLAVLLLGPVAHGWEIPGTFCDTSFDAGNNHDFVQLVTFEKNFSPIYYAVDGDSLYVKLKRVNGPSPALPLYGTFGAIILIVSIFFRKMEESRHFPR